MACAWNGATFFRHCTARLHLSFSRAGLKIGTGPRTLIVFSTAEYLQEARPTYARHG